MSAGLVSGCHVKSGHSLVPCVRMGIPVGYLDGVVVKPYRSSGGVIVGVGGFL